MIRCLASRFVGGGGVEEVWRRWRRWRRCWRRWRRWRRTGVVVGIAGCRLEEEVVVVVVVG